MMDAFFERKGIVALMLLFFCCSILGRVVLGIAYEKLIQETENVAVTQNALLKQCKLKFIRCFQLNGGVNNVPVFVDKFMNRLAIGPFAFEKLYHYTGQTMLLSVVTCGIGICKSLASGKTVMHALPFYGACFAELYLFFAISAAVDVPEKKRVLKTNLVDYLENHLAARIGTTQKDLEALGYVAPGERFVDKQPEKMRRMEREEPEEPFRPEDKNRLVKQENESKLSEQESKSRPSEQEEKLELMRQENVQQEASMIQKDWDALLEELLTI